MNKRLRLLLPLFLLFVFAPSAQAQLPGVNISIDTPVGLDVSARGITSGGCTPSGTWEFDWGDDTTTDVTSDYTNDYSHTYAASGRYAIRLTYICSGRPSAVTWKWVTVTKPEVTLAASVTGVNASARASTNSACTASGDWTLDWGDGSTEVTIDEDYTDSYTHKYETGGTFTVELTWLCNSKTTETTTSQELTVTSPDVALATSASGLTARAKATANETCSASGDWSLDWGDGTTAVTISSGYGSTRRHTYATEGSYTVELTWLCNDFATEHTASSEISVKPLPVVALTVRYVDEALSPGLVAALATVPSWTMSQIVYNWGDGESSTVASNLGAEAQYSYAEGICGRRTVTARATLQEDSRVVSGRQSVVFPACPKPPEDRSSRARPRDSAGQPVPTQDHSRLPAGASVTSDSPWIQFYEVSGAGIAGAAAGQQSVQERGARSAIDIWGPVGVDAVVCFADRGSLLLLDAATSPRAEVPLNSYPRGDGKTCAQLDRAGTVVLMPGEPTHNSPPIATPPPSGQLAPLATATPGWDPYLIPDSLDTMVALENCQVGSLYILNLRESPAGPIMRWFNGLSPALARTPNWFQVVDQGELGWISAHYVSTSGDCG